VNDGASARGVDTLLGLGDAVKGAKRCRAAGCDCAEGARFEQGAA
jgi:hypothetical protein